MSLSLEGPSSSHFPRAQNKATAGTFPGGLLTLTTMWPEPCCPGTLASPHLLPSACSHKAGAGLYCPAEPGGFPLPGRTHARSPKSSLIWTVQPVVKFLQHEVILQPELLTQGHGLLEEGASGDQISSPTKSSPWSILMLF